MQFLVRFSTADPNEVKALERLDDEYEVTYTEVFSKLLYDEPVFMRYKVLPFAKEVYAELDYKDLTCVSNSLSQHKILTSCSACSSELAIDLAGMDSRIIVPHCYSQYDMPHLPSGAYVLKGETNSIKSQWSTHMYAPTKAEVPYVFSRLVTDSLVGNQNIVIRPYYPLVQLTEGINGIPVSVEYRMFFFRGKLLDISYYWTNYFPDGYHLMNQYEAQLMKVAEDLEQTDFVQRKVAFVAIDVALTETGQWVVVDVNDGQMSGLPFAAEEARVYDFYKSIVQELRPGEILD